MNVVSFSGGKDSTAMLLMMLENKIPIDRIICVDTTKEFPAMYRHIAKVQEICPVEIEHIQFNFDYWFGEHIKTRGKNRGKVGYGFPDFRNRWCTNRKRLAFMRQLEITRYKRRSYDGTFKVIEPIVEYHGIAFDEKSRCGRNGADHGRDIRYPLVEWGITQEQALKYCYSKGLDWEGLYDKFYRVTCWCCPMSRIGELKTLYNEFPELWQQLIEMDKKSYRKFRPDYSVDELSKRFAEENLQDQLLACGRE